MSKIIPGITNRETALCHEEVFWIDLAMNKVLIILFMLLSTLAWGQKKVKSTKAQKANMTPEQRMVAGNKKGKKQSPKQKIKKSKKQDKQARRNKGKKRK